MSSAKVVVKSDGTPEGTEVLVDGKTVDCTSLTLVCAAGQLPRVVMELYVDEVDLNGSCELHTSAVHKAHRGD
jgi:hypothetical protein